MCGSAIMLSGLHEMLKSTVYIFLMNNKINVMIQSQVQSALVFVGLMILMSKVGFDQALCCFLVTVTCLTVTSFLNFLRAPFGNAQYHLKSCCWAFAPSTCNHLLLMTDYRRQTKIPWGVALDHLVYQHDQCQLQGRFLNACLFYEKHQNEWVWSCVLTQPSAITCNLSILLKKREAPLVLT